MKKYSYTFSIDEPCSENWQNMSASEKGKFCMNCQKEVVDFTSLKDEEIIRLIENSKGSVCGRFETVQLNKPMQVSYNLRRPYSMKLIVAGIVLLTVVSPVYLNATDKPVVEVQQHSSFINPVEPAKKDSVFIFKGRLLNKVDGTPVANVEVQSGEFSATTDAEGRFELKISQEQARELFFVHVYPEEYMYSAFEVNGLNTDYSKEYTVYIENRPVKMGKVRIQRDTILNK